MRDVDFTAIDKGRTGFRARLCAATLLVATAGSCTAGLVAARFNERAENRKALAESYKSVDTDRRTPDVIEVAPN